ncbi:MAG: MraY family glycosyltransferase [Bryobacteraceae bacterium]
MIDFAPLVWTSGIALLAALVLTPMVRDTFVRLGMVDRPDGERKLHLSAVPRVGGIAIVLSYVAAFALALPVIGPGQLLPGSKTALVIRLLPAVAAIFLTGLVDDLFGLKPWQKLGGQLAAAGLALAAGVRVSTLGGWELGDASTVVTVAWLIGCTNAFNLIDGLDGLASGTGLFSTLTIFMAALVHHDQTLALATLPLCGSLLGFLRYNFNPASVFLGDSGSLFIGFLLGCYGALWSQKSATLLGITAPLMALAIPLLDVSLSILRRWLRGRPIFGADRHHIHHKLLDKGLTHRRVVIVLYMMCGIYATLSLLTSVSANQSGGLILVLFCAVTWVGVQHLGYFEFGQARRFFFGGALRRALEGQIALHALERGIDGAATEEQCWRRIDETAHDFGFLWVQARLNGIPFRSTNTGPGEACWQLRVPLPGGDWVNLHGPFEADRCRGTAGIGPLMEVLHHRLASRLAVIKGMAEEEPRPMSETISLLHLAQRAGTFEGPAPTALTPASRELRS